MELNTDNNINSTDKIFQTTSTTALNHDKQIVDKIIMDRVLQLFYIITIMILKYVFKTVNKDIKRRQRTKKSYKEPEYVNANEVDPIVKKDANGDYANKHDMVSQKNEYDFKYTRVRILHELFKEIEHKCKDPKKDDNIKNKEKEEDEKFKLNEEHCAEEKEKNKHKCSHKEKEKDKNKDFYKDNVKDKDSDKDKDKGKGKGKDKDKDKDSDKEKEKDSDKEKEKDSDKEKEKDSDKEKEKDSDKEKEKDSDKDKEKDSDKGKDKDSDKEKDKSKDKEKDKDNNKEKDIDKEKKKEKTKEKEIMLQEGTEEKRLIEKGVEKFQSGMKKIKEWMEGKDKPNDDIPNLLVTVNKEIEVPQGKVQEFKEGIELFEEGVKLLKGSTGMEEDGSEINEIEIVFEKPNITDEEKKKKKKQLVENWISDINKMVDTEVHKIISEIENNNEDMSHLLEENKEIYEISSKDMKLTKSKGCNNMSEVIQINKQSFNEDVNVNTYENSNNNTSVNLYNNLSTNTISQDSLHNHLSENRNSEDDLNNSLSAYANNGKDVNKMDGRKLNIYERKIKAWNEWKKNTDIEWEIFMQMEQEKKKKFISKKIKDWEEWFPTIYYNWLAYVNNLEEDFMHDKWEFWLNWKKEDWEKLIDSEWIKQMEIKFKEFMKTAESSLKQKQSKRWSIWKSNKWNGLNGWKKKDWNFEGDEMWVNQYSSVQNENKLKWQELSIQEEIDWLDWVKAKESYITNKQFTEWETWKEEKRKWFEKYINLIKKDWLDHNPWKNWKEQRNKMFQPHESEEHEELYDIEHNGKLAVLFEY
ncbi:tryptophan-rich antigen, putative [Plasmodium sp. DRC-Itaito]|nr:tryptophan-rich antigen, putative [Plasmodium sp. DRC-Itaito]